MNRDESLRCLEISKKKFAAGETVAALKFANKAIALDVSTETQTWLEFLNNQSSTADTKPSSTSTGPNLRQRHSSTSETHSSSSSKPTAAQEDESSRPFTDLQVKGIKKIRAFKTKGDLYGILGLEKDCSESDIKKAYRKLALQFHPDKCGAPGTDEAFKAISHAFTVLGDSDKKEHYDRYGIDPDTRAGAAAASRGGAGFRGFNGQRFEGDISPEDLFRMFMGGDDFPGFGGAGFHTFSSNSQPRARFRQAQARQGTQVNSSSLLQIIQMLPVIFLGLFTLASLLSSTQPDAFSFTKSRDYPEQHTTSIHKVPYYVNSEHFKSNWASSESKTKVLEGSVEKAYLQALERGCRSELENKRFQIQQSYGLFGVDKKMLKRAQGMRLPNCERVDQWNNES
ncbi:hypothetical protein BATDEDRAFT_14248 [Batrachochytrium dendrobatidis JAM81]|uniref:J domain-containing protein n=1 Tax=Batrachochytrium dendrobatidis (strain JAM81 / FGSC 10211) TaxID=684364 RepID=F4PCC4_BATDJ|nr:uncharacterized protein BATDEDRAFT_14248 [Batrachochytrium dendrobatidis JAM81]EGF77257.1 hypothetical protein BATDEDRAFT_14248 [Batrachochytrium dendrobatidis JAM81]KAJ8330582.1 Chaperone protein dnaJ [Batrachochytrium dendrobatidis]KAK5665554.1 Chaperone protein dnaJ [Batrachochytrium dendrobatidis]|eukprot:XP_006682126.1 hypothetical protein BATDEDRAFT_14248 [Batrachochytrium dendrobatidis JAM81]